MEWKGGGRKGRGVTEEKDIKDHLNVLKQGGSGGEIVFLLKN